jgi:hypothetical protein
MSNPSDFVIENGMLVKYNGTDADVVIPEGVTSIGKSAFFWCKSLQSVTIPEGVTRIGDSAFNGCSRLQSVTIPKGVTSIGNSAFYWCSSLQNVTIPAGVTSIGKRAFDECKSLQSVTIPDSVTSIGSWAFSNTAWYYAQPDGLVYAGKVVYGYKGEMPENTSVKLNEGTTGIADSAFNGCNSLKSVTIPESVTSIGDWAFCECRSLQSVTIPNNATTIGAKAFGGCEKLADPDGLIIVKGIVFDYCGQGGSVSIPTGVTSIGDSAFSGCKSLQSVTIPDSVTNIGDCAFYECESLQNITIPAGVTSIGNAAFRECKSLQSVTIPAGVTSIGRWAFSGCKSLKSVIIPEGVTSIGDSAFYNCANLRKVTLPDSLTEIGEWVFAACEKITELIYHGVLQFCGKDFFGEHLPKGLVPHVRELYPLMKDVALKQYVLDKSVWSKLDAELKKDIYLARPGKPLLAVYLKVVDPSLAEAIGNELCGVLSEKPSAKDCAKAASFMTAFSAKTPPALLQKLYGLLKAAKTGEKALKTVEKNVALMDVLGKPLTVDTTLSPTEQYVMAILYKRKISQKELEVQLKNNYGLVFVDLPELKEKNGHAAAPFVFAYLLTAHEHIATRGKEWSATTELCAEFKKPGIRHEASGLIALLDVSSLYAGLQMLADKYLVQYQNSKKKYLAFPVCRYANEDLMRDLCARAPKWVTSVSGIDAPPLKQFREAVLYSDTRAAMLFADCYDALDEYAKLRGTDADTLRDIYLSDVGLDENRGKAYDLGNQTVTARLQKDLSFIFELPNGKTAKSLPKKGADEAKYAAAKADFDEMRKSVKKILKNRFNRLFEDFLSGRTRDAAGWQASYLHNPLLRQAASLIAWTQGDSTFTLTENSVIDSAEQPYEITDKPICVAHPMAMPAADIAAWQKYFTKHGLKQPFAQVWEPVRMANQIRPDRYAGIELDIMAFSGKEKHGIHSYGLHAYSEVFGFSLDDCTLDYDRSTWRLGFYVNDGYTYKLGEFRFPKFTRKVNHIVTILDGLTVAARIVKDDVTVADMLPGFTLAQITEFIAAAQEANAANVLALLLEYKNAHFADFDPMEAFTLEW